MTAKAETSKGGRPVEYRPAFANELIELMGSGLSLTASMASLGFTRETANDWSRKYPEFSDAIALGKGKRSLFLEKRGIAAESGPAVTFVMKALANCNREDFTDKFEHEISGKDGAAIKHEIGADAAFTELAAALGSVARGQARGAVVTGSVAKPSATGTDNA